MSETLRILRTYDDLLSAVGRRPVRAARGPARRSGGPASGGPRGGGVRAPEPARPPVDGLHRQHTRDRPAAGRRAGGRAVRRPGGHLGVGARRRGNRCCTSTSRSATAATGSGCGRRRLPRWCPARSVSSTSAARDLPQVQDCSRSATRPPTPAPASTATRLGGCARHDGRLVACAVMERNGAGRPHLAGITVHPSRAGARPGPGDDRAPDPTGRRARRCLHPRHVRRQRRRPPAVPRAGLRHRPRLVQPPGPAPRAARPASPALHHFVPAARRSGPWVGPRIRRVSGTKWV